MCDHNFEASQNNSRSKDVTTLDWSPDGALLATGCYDGWARVFSKSGARRAGAGRAGGRLPACSRLAAPTVQQLQLTPGAALPMRQFSPARPTSPPPPPRPRACRAAGELVRVLKKHTGPIFSLKWNKKGSYLLSGSVDRTAIMWDAKTGEVKQQWQLHQGELQQGASRGRGQPLRPLPQRGAPARRAAPARRPLPAFSPAACLPAAPTLDVDWKDNITFATCSTDHMIYVCRWGLGWALQGGGRAGRARGLS